MHLDYIASIWGYTDIIVAVDFDGLLVIIGLLDTYRYIVYNEYMYQIFASLTGSNEQYQV